MKALLSLCDRVLTGTARITAHVAAVLGVLVASFVALSAAMRYFVGRPFAFSEELVGLMVVALAFLALPHALAEGRHIRITALAERLPPAVRHGAGVIALATLSAFCVLFLIEMRSAIAFSLRFNTRTEMGDLPLYPWMFAVCFGLALLGLLAVVRWLRAVLEGGEA